MSEEVWYVSYGSNMCRDRLGAYLLGGQPVGARQSHVGARTPSMLARGLHAARGWDRHRAEAYVLERC